MKRKNCIAWLSLALALTLASTRAAPAGDGRAPDAAGPRTGSISGRIQNVVTGQYLERAQVTITGTDRIAFTDESGTYRLTQVPVGAVVLEIFYTGLDPQTIAVQTHAGRNIEQDVGLNNVARYGQLDNVVKLDRFVVASAKDTEGESLATNEQRFAPNIKNVVATDAFGDVPEGNLAEFMKFLPGVSVTGSDAELETVSLRGLPDNLTSITTDGVQTANANVGGNTRSFQLSEVSIHNVSRIEVTKLPLPSNPADSLAGAVNMVSKSAFERSRAQFNYRVFFSGNSDALSLRPTPETSEKRGYKVLPGLDFDLTVPVSKDFGLVITGLTSNQFNQMHRSGMTWSTSGNGTGASLDKPFLQIHQLDDGPKNTFRRSLSLKADWRVTRNSVLTLGLVASHYYTYYGTMQRIVNTTTNGVPTIAPAAGGVAFSFGNDFTLGATGRGTVTTGTGGFTNQTQANMSGNIRYRFDNGTWRIDAGHSPSRATSDFRQTSHGHFGSMNITLASPVRIKFAGITAIRPDVIQAFDNNNREVDLNNLSNYRLNTANTNPRDVSDAVQVTDLNVRRQISFLPFPAAVQIGGIERVQTRDSRRFSTTWTYNGAAGDLSPAPYRSLVYANQDSYWGFKNIAWASPARAWEAYQANPALFTRTPAQMVTEAQFQIVNSQYLRETVAASYAQTEARLWRNRLNLVTGVRFEKTTDEGLGPLFDPNAVYVRNPDGSFARTPNGARIRRPDAGAVGSIEELRLIRRERGYRAERSYDGYFPSFHLTYNVTENFLARLAYARTYGRPDFSQIIPNSTINESDVDPNAPINPGLVPGTISVVNTGLRPWKANNFDLSLEYYSPQGGLFSAGVFMKEIRDFFGSAVRVATAADLAALDLDPGFVGWQLSTKFNVPDLVRIEGVELNFRHSLRPLGRWGESITVFANATKLNLIGEKGADFSGFIAESINWGFTFKRAPAIFMAKWNFQGDQKLAATPAFGPDAFQYRKARTNLDLNLDYQLGKRLSFFATARSIFNQPTVLLTYGSQTPRYARQSRAAEYGVYLSAGIKGTF